MSVGWSFSAAANIFASFASLIPLTYNSSLLGLIYKPYTVKIAASLRFLISAWPIPKDYNSSKFITVSTLALVYYT